jgi:outer membrane protein assembly factor BamB
MNARLALVAVLLSVGFLAAGDWPQFRGPNASGVSDEKDLPSSWGPTENVKWKVETPGRSVASPVVFGKKVFVTSSSGIRNDRLHVQCIDADTGKLLWHRQLAATGNTGHHPKSSMAAPSPCVNAEGVYCLFATADLAAYDLDGNLKWYRSLAEDYPNIANQVGMASSPVLHKDFLIVPMDTAGDSFLAAVDTTYGKNVWKIERPREINWVTPTLRVAGSVAELIFATPKETIAYTVTDGKKSWSVAGESGGIPTAVTSGEKVLLPSRGNLVCLQPGENGAMKELWRNPKLSPGNASPLVYDGRVYSVGRAGTLICANLSDGKELWSERVSKGKGTFWASPIAGDGKIYTFDDAGICTVLKAGDTAQVLASNDLKEEIMGTPALANGCVYIRTVSGVWCVSEKKK